MHRLIGMPLIIGTLFFITHLIGRNPSHSIYLISNLSLMLFVFFSLWATRNSSASIIDEVNQKTWDFQKLSALTPWQMTIGKFLGSTAYPWFGAIIALVTYGITLYLLTFHYHDWRSINFTSLDTSLIIMKVTILFIAALLTQTIAMFGAASTLGNNKERISTFNGLGFVVIAAIIGYIFLYIEQQIWGIQDHRHYINRKYRTTTPEFISWYGMQFNYAGFVLCSLLACLSWVMIGTYRIIKKELQYRLIPTAWCGFLLFTLFFIAGFLYKISPYPIALYFTFLLITTTYSLTFMQSKNITIYRKLKHCVHHKQKRKFLETTPLWIPTFAMATTLSFIACAYALYHIDSSITQNFLKEYRFRRISDYKQTFTVDPIFYVALFLTPLFMVMRDILIIHYFNMASKRKRGNLTALLYLFLLYAVLPALLLKLKLPIAAHTLLPLPLPYEYLSNRAHAVPTLVPWLTIVAAFVQMACVTLLLKRKLRKNAMEEI